MRLLALLFHDVYADDPAVSGFSGPAADRYKLTVSEFERQLTGLARARPDRPVLATRLGAEGAGGVPFAITVDDGGVSFYTDVADRLEGLGWRGHCFVTTGFIGHRGFLDKAQIRDLHRRGHVIGSHSVSHPTRFSACAWTEMVREWEDSRKALADVLGEDVVVASVPGGYFSARVAEAARETGLHALFTSEPDTRVREISGRVVMGRFTVRAGCALDFAGRLGALERPALVREWARWNAKKTAKAFLGAAYPRLAGRWGSR